MEKMFYHEFFTISASKKMYDLLGPGATERWFYWRSRSKEQVSQSQIIGKTFVSA